MSPLAGLRHFLASTTQMSSAKNPTPDAYPAVPSTLNAHVLDDAPPYDAKAAAIASTDPALTPYLGLRARLSQVWLNRWTILILLVLARVLLATQGLEHDIAQAKTEALSACTSVENMGSAMASMPYYMSIGVNEMAATGVTAAVQGLMQMLILMVTGVENLVLFVINMMTSTYVCLATTAIDSSLESSTELIIDVADTVTKEINSIADDIASGVSTFEDAFNSFLSAIGDLSGLLGGSDDPPQLNLTSEIDALEAINIDPSDFTQPLQELNNSLPTFSQVQNATNTVISLPFEELKKLINESMSTYTFNASVFPPAQKETLTFCSDNNSINSFFDELTNVALTARTVFIVVLSIAAALACVPMAYKEIRAWRTMRQRSTLMQKNAFDPMDVVYLVSRPYTSTAGIRTAARFKSTKNQVVWRWFVAYGTSVPALFVLALGVAGLLACLCQFILLEVVVKEIPQLSDEVGDFAETVVAALNNASTQWAVAANGVVAATNNDINNELFGWVNTSTTAVNDTLNTFVDEMTKGINETFGGTILYDPVSEVFNCLIGLKVASIEKGLTWVHDHAHVDFPEFANDTFSLGAVASLTNSSADDSFLSSPGSVTSDDITSAVVSMAEFIKAGIIEEAWISFGLVMVWLIVVLMGGARAMWQMKKREKTRAEGGSMGYGTREQVHAFTGDGQPGPYARNAASPPFPVFGSSETSVDRNHEEYWGGPVDEKVGHAGHRSVESGVHHGHQRSSSYGKMAGVDEKS